MFITLSNYSSQKQFLYWTTPAKKNLIDYSNEMLVYSLPVAIKEISFHLHSETLKTLQDKHIAGFFFVE